MDDTGEEGRRCRDGDWAIRHDVRHETFLSIGIATLSFNFDLWPSFPQNKPTAPGGSRLPTLFVDRNASKRARHTSWQRSSVAS